MARILIIDDDPAMVSVISDICQERGHQTIAYTSGQKAIENLATHAPQLVISDLRMDKVGGLDILRECQRGAAADAGDPDHGLQDGGDARSRR